MTYLLLDIILLKKENEKNLKFSGGISLPGVLPKNRRLDMYLVAEINMHI